MDGVISRKVEFSVRLAKDLPRSLVLRNRCSVGKIFQRLQNINIGDFFSRDSSNSNQSENLSSHLTPLKETLHTLHLKSFPYFWLQSKWPMDTVLSQNISLSTKWHRALADLCPLCHQLLAVYRILNSEWFAGTRSRLRSDIFRD